MVFCCIVVWIQPDISGCQQDFLVVWRWNQLRTFLGIFENNFIDFREAVSLEKIFEIVQENTLKFSKLISFLGNKKSSSNQNVWRDHATMQQDVLLHFWVIFLYQNQAKISKSYSVVQLFVPTWSEKDPPGLKVSILLTN